MDLKVAAKNIVKASEESEEDEVKQLVQQAKEAGFKLIRGLYDDPSENVY